MDRMKDYIKALKVCDGYSWIAQHGHTLRQDELIDIIKELEYAISHSIDYEDVYNEAAINLHEMYVEEY